METSYARKAKYCARPPPLERLVYHNQGRFQFERFCALSRRGSFSLAHAAAAAAHSKPSQNEMTHCVDSEQTHHALLLEDVIISSEDI
jgi:hypothetical protein